MARRSEIEAPRLARRASAQQGAAAARAARRLRPARPRGLTEVATRCFGTRVRSWESTSTSAVESVGEGSMGSILVAASHKRK